jgi:type IV pilus biogenesis protein CpaD/CtpE
MKRVALVTFVALALSACATPETRVRTALMDAGLSRPIAACMADRMVDRLSLVQLNKLSGLKKLRGQDMRKILSEAHTFAARPRNTGRRNVVRPYLRCERLNNPTDNCHPGHQFGMTII